VSVNPVQPQEKTLNKLDSNADSSTGISADKPVSYEQKGFQNGNGKPRFAFAETAGVKSMIEQKKIEVPSITLMDSEFVDEDVQRCFHDYCEMLFQNDDRGYEASVIRNSTFEKKSHSEWELVLGSSAEAEAFRKLDTQSWFREKLNNRNFSLQFRIEQKAEKNRTLTKEEKVKEFIKTHPEVQKFMIELDAIPDI
jgi:hypothetical protein